LTLGAITQTPQRRAARAQDERDGQIPTSPAPFRRIFRNRPRRTRWIHGQVDLL